MVKEVNVIAERERLAAPWANPMPPGADRQTRALQVRMGDDRDGAIPLSELDAVIECPPVSAVPAAPQWLLGVAAYQGRLLPVVDLAALAGDAGGKVANPDRRVLLVEAGVHCIAFSVAGIRSEILDELQDDVPQIALRALAARLLGAPPNGHLVPGTEPTAR